MGDDGLTGRRIVATLGRLPADLAVHAGLELVQAGFTAVEVTITGTGGLSAVGGLRRALTDPAVVVGAAGVRTPADVVDARNVGAQYVATPVARVDVIGEAFGLDLPVACGALTPTEIDAAWSAGAGQVRLFPACLGGPGYLRDVQGPLPGVPLVPAGGVTAESIGAYASAGAAAVAIDWTLADTGHGTPEDWEYLRQRAKLFVQAAEAAPWRPV